MGNRATICVIGPEEVEMLKQNIAPNCNDHYHVSRLEANQRTGRGDFKPYFVPIAEWVGPKQIRMLALHGMRGLACKVGEFHAKAIKKRKQWALVMYEQIKQRPLESLQKI